MFTFLKWLNIQLNYPPWMENILRFTLLKFLGGLCQKTSPKRGPIWEHWMSPSQRITKNVYTPRVLNILLTLTSLNVCAIVKLYSPIFR